MINNISFGSNNYGRYNGYSSTSSRQGASYTRPSSNDYDFDSFYSYQEIKNRKQAATQNRFQSNPKSRTQQKPANVSNKKTKHKKSLIQKIGLPLALFGIGAGAGASTVAIVENHNNPSFKPETVIVRNISEFDGLEDIASTYGANEEFILGVNDAESFEELQDKEEVMVPYEYSPVQEKIDDLTKKLYAKGTTDEQRVEINEEIAALKEKKAAQDEVAFVYQDGKKVYFVMKKSVEAPTLRSLFGIEEGALRKNNNLSAENWVVYSPGNGEKAESYVDYNCSTLVKGKTYKVKLSDIQG